MKHVSEFPRKIVEHADMGIVMRDGIRLSARVWMPEDAEQKPVPMILEHIPYRKRDGTIHRDEFSHPWMAGQGYCCIRTDIRGNGESEGLMDDEYTEQELQDACDVIAWAAQQPWCNGNVGMQGISWGGFNCLQVAALQPEALKAVISVCSTVDRYADDIHYKGGTLLVENFGWAANMLSYSSRPPDPLLVGDNWTEIWRRRLEAQPWLWGVWHAHQHRDSYWKHGSVCEDYSAIKAAVLSVGGWHDGYRNTISHLVENVSAPTKGIVGPWIHKYPHYAGPKPAIGFMQESKRWWDKWLKGIDTGVENDPAYRAYLMDSIKPERWLDERPGRWIAEKEWPSLNINKRAMHLGQNILCDETAACGLSISSAQHCGLASGEYFPFAFADELPGEQTGDDELSLCFDGEATPVAIDIVGAPEVRLSVSSDKPQAQIAVRLCDLRPDGTSALVTHGVFNLTHYRSHEFPEPLVHGKRYDVRFMLDQIAYHLPSGHRLRVAVSTSYWPYFWPSPEVTEITVHTGKILIPQRAPTSDIDECSFDEPVGSPAWQYEELRPSSYSRKIQTDNRTACVTISLDDGEKRDLEHGLISGTRLKEVFSIQPNDPNSAKAASEWEQTGGREGAMWRTHIEAEMTCDAKKFHSTAMLQAYLNDALFFEHEYKDSKPRK